jgi:hypothetical protein
MRNKYTCLRLKYLGQMKKERLCKSGNHAAFEHLVGDRSGDRVQKMCAHLRVVAQQHHDLLFLLRLIGWFGRFREADGAVAIRTNKANSADIRELAFMFIASPLLIGMASALSIIENNLPISKKAVRRLVGGEFCHLEVQ